MTPSTQQQLAPGVVELEAALEGRSRYQATGLLAIDPQALFMLFAQPATEAVNETIGDVEIVRVCGPLDRRSSRWCDSYEAIKGRAKAAFSGTARAVLLHIDSPGGDVAGCFETARELRAMARESGKPFYSFVDSKAASAGYAFAAAADVVSLAPTALVGSIGVISSRIDFSAQNEQRGVRYAIVASGARKTDGNPDFPITEAELVETKAIVDSMALVFFDLVAELRNTTPQAVAALQARMFHGQGAKSAGLVDHVQTFDQLLAMIAGSTGEASMQAASAYEKAKAALQEAAKVDDANGKAAKKALDALGVQSEPGETPEETPPATPPAAAAAASAPATQISAAAAGALAATVQTQGDRLSKLEAKSENDERAALIAGRPDLNPELVKVLATQSLADVKAIIATIPRTTPKPAATATVTGTAGEGQGDGNASRLPPSQKSSLDARMGMTQMTAGIVDHGLRLELGAPVPATPKPAAATPNASTPSTPAK